MRTVVYNTCWGDGLFCRDHNVEATGVYNDCVNENNQIEDIEDVPRHDETLRLVVEKMKLRYTSDYGKIKTKQVPGKYRIREYDGREWVEKQEDVVWL